MPKKRRCRLLLLSLLSMPAFAVKTDYTFDDRDYLAPAREFAGWQSTIDRHLDQRAQLNACREEKQACRGRLRSYHHVMQRAQSLDTTDRVELVHHYINKTRYGRDRVRRLYDDDGNKIGIQRNEFATLYEFLTERGDCEDYATAKYFMLRDLGIPAEQMRVVVVYERQYRSHHAVLAVEFPDATWLMDSDNTIRRRNHWGFRYIYSMNEHSVWDHREDLKRSRY